MSAPSPVAGPDLIWLLDGQTARQYILIDWSGRRLGALTLEGQVLPSPDGRQAVLNASTFIDSTGRSLGALQVGESDIRDVAWAEDSRHVCVLAEPASAGPDTGASSLWLAQTGQPARKIGVVGQPGSIPGLTACSLTNDRAVVVSDFGAHIPPPQGDKHLLTALVQVIKISTGAVLYQHDYLAATPASPLLVASSSDGRYLIENSLDQTATIRDLDSGHTVGSLSGAYVQAFSWDGTRVLLTTTVGTAQAVEVVDWATQKVLWEQVVDLGGVLPHRQTADVLFAVLSGGSSDIFLLAGAGPAKLLAHDAFLVSACPCLGAGAGA